MKDNKKYEIITEDDEKTPVKDAENKLIDQIFNAKHGIQEGSDQKLMELSYV
jgi:hypothetical protein